MINADVVGKLYVVGTPIGNLEDITARAARVLAEVDCVAAEDTRHTGGLLAHLGLRTRQISCHKFNEARRRDELLTRFRAGQSVALVSDAGMPGISDPGERIIRMCLEEGIDVEVVPGPSAVTHALVASGFATVPFYFGGFFPMKSGGRQIEAEAALQRACTSVYFESPHRLERTLRVFGGINPNRPLCVARELTKKFEEVRRGTAADLLERYAEGPIKGEICLVVSAPT